MRAEGEVLRFPSERVEAWARFDTFFEEQHERLFNALYFVAGNRADAEELMQDAFLKLWERWDSIDRIDDPIGYLFKVALNGFRMRRRRAAMSLRKAIPTPEVRDLFLDAEMRTDVRAMLLRLTPRQRAALLLVDLFGYPSEQAGRILGVRPSTVRALATQGRRALRGRKERGMPDVQEVFRMSTQKVRPDPGALERQHTRQRRRSVGKKTGAFAVAAAIVFGLVALIMGTRDGVVDPIPAIESPPPAPPTPPSPFLLDLRTGEMTRLPETIVDVEIYVYVASPDGGRVAFSGPDHPLTITELDGNEARTIRLPEGSNGIGPAWSPDGGSLLYQLRSGENDVGELVVEDLSTGRRRELTHLERGNVWWWFLRPTFTADGRHVLYHLPRTAGEAARFDVWSVPVAGGSSTVLLRNAQFPVSLPDGRIAVVEPGAASLGGPRLQIVGADGGRRTLVEAESDDGIWDPRPSPDGARIAYGDGGSVRVVDVATGEVTRVAEGGFATWLDDDTLIVMPA